MKTMKRFLSAGLALCLACTMLPAGAGLGTEALGKETEIIAVETTSGNGTTSGNTPAISGDAVEAPITVQKVENLSEDFIHGVDVSSYLSLIESGAKYYDENGDEENLFTIMENGGVNYVRLRVWNSPYPLDEDGNYKFIGADGETEYTASEVKREAKTEGALTKYYLEDGTQVYRQTYGAGVCDVETAAIIGKVATEHNMKVLIDFHYSDFWADPKKKSVPKKWEELNLEDKSAALAEFTEESLNTIIDAGVDVGMVQIGNEINNGMSGEKDVDAVHTLLKSAGTAVRKVAQEKQKEILIAVHFTDPNSEGYQYGRAQGLEDAGVDYDVFATSYYPFWHGSPETLKASLQPIAEDFDKKVMVAEISWAWTFEDGDGYPNVVNADAGDQEYNYPIDVEGQATAIRDTIAAISEIGDKGIGTFYWEPAWIPVNKYDAEAADAEEVLAENVKAWKIHGSGWGTIFAAEYDPEITDEKNGGTWDNQAYFDFDGNVLPSMNVYKWVYTGAVGPTRVATVESASCEMQYHADPVLPDKVKANLNDGREIEVGVTWRASEVEALKTADFGEYVINGSVNEFSYEIDGGETMNVAAGTYQTTCTVNIIGDNLITNGGFETGNADGWTLTNYAGENVGWPKVDKGTNNSKSGDYFYTAWAEEPMDFAIEQKLNNVPSGKYMLFAYYQGTGVQELDDSSSLYAIVTYKDGTKKTYSGAVEIPNVWRNFYQAKVRDIVIDSTVKEVQVGTRIACTATELGAWVVIDDISLMKTGDVTDSGTTTPPATKDPVKPSDNPKPSPTVPAKGTKLTDTKTNLKYQVTGQGSIKNGVVTGAEVAYTGTAKSKSSITIPDTVTINGVTYQVTSIAAKALKGNKKLTKVTIGKNIKSIGKEAFSGCKKLKTVTIKATKLTSVGKNAFKNLPKNATIKVPKKQYKKYKKLLTSKTGFKKTMKLKKQ